MPNTLNGVDVLRDPTENDLVQSLLSRNTEGLVITVSNNKVAVFHKFKDKQGVLNSYLTALLQEMLSKSKRVPDHSSDHRGFELNGTTKANRAG